MVQIKKIFHHEIYQIGIYFGIDDELNNKAKSIGAKWSKTHKCWYVLYNKENYNQIKRTFGSIEIIRDNNNERHTEPALIKQETVHIAEVIGEIQLIGKAEHKGTVPEIAGKIVYLGITGKYWILKVPYKEGLTPKLMDIKGVYWNKKQKAFFVLRHVNVKIKVEALLGIGEIFPPEYFNLETVVSNKNTFIELNEYKLDKKWMILSCPPVSYFIEQVRRWEGSRYSKAHGAYLLTATPAMLENLQKLSGELNIPIHNNLPERYLSKYKAMNKKESQLKNLRESLLLQIPVMAQTYTLAMLDYLMAQNYSANTIRNYVKSFNLFLRINQYQNPDTLTEMQIIRHLAGMTEKGLSPSSLIYFFVFDF